MGLPKPKPRFDFESYLAFEAEQTIKHEYARGEIFAMAGAAPNHATICLNLGAAFKSHLRGSRCRTYVADVKLRIEAADVGFYPDVFVTCDFRDLASRLVMRHALLVVEVLSDSTAAYDRGGKFADYRALEDLREYVMVDIEARRVECYRRNPEKRWVLYEYSGEGECEFASIGLALPLALVFEDLDPPMEAGGRDAEQETPYPNG